MYDNNNNQNQQHPKNPNSGYLKPSKYGQDEWCGVIEINGVKHWCELRAQADSQYGPYRRIVFKPHTPRDHNTQGNNGGGNPPYNQGYAQAPQPQQNPQPQPGYNQPQQGYQPQPAYQPTPQQAPAFVDDEIPFG